MPDVIREAYGSSVKRVISSCKNSKLAASSFICDKAYALRAMGEFSSDKVDF